MTEENTAPDPAADPEPAAAPESPEDIPSVPDLDALLARHAESGGDPTSAPAPSAGGPEEPATAPPADDPPADPAPEPPADDRTARSLEVLAEQQRTHRAEVEADKTAREAWASEKEALLADVAKFEAFKTKVNRDDALGALEDMGIKFDDITKAVLDGRGVNPTSQLADEMTTRLSDVEKRLDARVKDIETREAAASKQAQETEFVREVTAELAKEDSGSPLVAALGDWGVQAVYQTFADTAAAQQHRGEPISLPSYRTVIEDVEQRVWDMISPLFSLPSVRERVLAARSETDDPSEAIPRTLSNRQAATVPIRTLPTDTSHIEDRDERIDAILANRAS